MTMTTPHHDDDLHRTTTAMNTRNTLPVLRTLVAAATLLLLLSGCGKLSTQEFDDSVELPESDTSADSVEPDTDAPDTTEPDTSEPDTSPDTADTTETDTADTSDTSDTGDASDTTPVEPIRELVTRPLFGGMPLENRFADPLFSLDASTWQAFALFERDWVGLRREFHAATPLDMPALVIPGTPGNPAGRGILGNANMGRGEHDVSIWLGRGVGEGDQGFVEVQLALLGYGTGGELAAVIGPVVGSTQVLGDVAWTRYEATVDGYLGWAELYVEDQSSETLFLAAPVITQRSAQPDGLGARRVAPLELRGTFTPRERAAFDTAVEQRRNNPPPRVRLEKLREQVPSIPAR